MSIQTVPSRRLLWWSAGLAAGSLAVLVLPGLAIVVLAADLTLLLIALTDWLVTPAPRLLSAERRAPERAWLFGKHFVEILLRNESRATLSLVIRDDFPMPLRPDVDSIRGTVPALGRTTLRYGICPATRGHFQFGAIHLRFGSLLGFWTLSKSVSQESAVRVYPAVDEVERYHLLAMTDRLPTLGIRRLPIRGASWEFESLREFINGDDTRLMDWKATARRNRLIIRNQQAERNQTIILLVDCGRLMTAEESGASKLDRAVNAVLLLAHVGLSRGDRLGLCTFSSKVHSWLAPRPQVGQMRLVTEALYNLQADYTESDHARCLRLVGLRHNKRSLLVVLTDFVDSETAAEMVAAVRHAARRHVVLFVALRDTFLEHAAAAPAGRRGSGFSEGGSARSAA